MPVVRELVNVISFRPDKASIESSKKSFKSIATSALKAVGIAVVAGATMQRKMEKNIATARFFGAELETINKIIEEQKGDVFSKMEISSAVSEMSDLAITTDQLTESLKVLKVASVAAGEMDLKKMTAQFDAIVKSGDVTAMRNIGAVTKEMAEMLNRTSFQASFAKANEKARTDMILSIMKNNLPRLMKLAKEQTDTVNFRINEALTSASDVTLKFGESTKEGVKEILGIVNDIIRGIEKMDGLWAGIKNFSDWIATTRQSSFWKTITGQTTKEESEQARQKNIQGMISPELQAQIDESRNLYSGDKNGAVQPKPSSPILPKITNVINRADEALGEAGIPTTSQNLETIANGFKYLMDKISYLESFKVGGGNSGSTSPSQNQTMKVDISGNLKVNGAEATPDLMYQLGRIVEKMVGYQFNKVGQMASDEDTGFTPYPLRG